MNGLNYLKKYSVIKGSTKFIYNCISCGNRKAVSYEVQSISCDKCGRDMLIGSCEKTIVPKVTHHRRDRGDGYCEKCGKETTQLQKIPGQGHWCIECVRFRL